MNIAIIGAGYTGLTAALRLAQAGHSVEIFEASKQVGGLASAFELNDTHIEKFYHHLFKTDTAIFNLIKELGLERKVVKTKSNIGIITGDHMLPFNGAMDLLKFTKLPVFDRIRLGMVALYLSKVNHKKQWDTVTAAAWMEKMCGKNAFNVVWKPLLVGKFDHYWDKVSMNWLWARIHVRANSRSSLLEEEYLYYFDGGFEVVTKALLKKLKSLGAVVHLDTPVQKITSQSKVTLQTHKASKTFDKVLATTSNRIFLEMTKNSLEDKKYKKQLESINYLHAICIVFTTHKSLSSYYWHNVNNLDSPFMVFIEHTNFVPVAKYANQHVFYLAKYTDNQNILKLSDEVIKKQWFSYLSTVLAGFKESDVISSVVTRAPFAQHIADLEYTKNIPAYKTPLNNIYLANFSQIYPYDRGTNYAVEEGEKIANLILK